MDHRSGLDNLRYPLCPELTYKEWNRLFRKDEKEAIDLSCRLSRRRILLDFGYKKRVPKHRLNKKGRHLP